MRRKLYFGISEEMLRRRRMMFAVLRGCAWNQDRAAARVRELAAAALEGAAAAALAHQDDRVRAGVERAMRRVALAADLEAGP